MRTAGAACVLLFLVRCCIGAQVVTIEITLDAAAELGGGEGLADTLAFVFTSRGYDVAAVRMDAATYTVAVMAQAAAPVAVLPDQCFIVSIDAASNDTNQNGFFFCVASPLTLACDCIPGYYSHIINGSMSSSASPPVTTSMSSSMSSSDCAACPVGTFKAEYGEGGCAPCAAGWSTMGLAGQPVCQPCPPNTVSAAAGGACVPCPPYSETPEYGSAACRCVAGTAPDYSGEWCVPCRPGQYEAQQRECLTCPPDGYGTSVAAGATACDVCVAGASPAAAGGCAQCPPGTFSPGGGDGCADCAAGHYSPLAGATACQVCAAGAYQPSAGGTACLIVECDYPVGAVPAGGGTACVCPPGTELDYSGGACAPCRPGFFQPRLASACIACPEYSTSLQWAASACDLCVPGAEVRGGDCAPCLPGYYYFGSSSLTSGCAPCPPGAS